MMLPTIRNHREDAFVQHREHHCRSQPDTRLIHSQRFPTSNESLSVPRPSTLEPTCSKDRGSSVVHVVFPISTRRQMAGAAPVPNLSGRSSGKSNAPIQSEEDTNCGPLTPLPNNPTEPNAIESGSHSSRKGHLSARDHAQSLPAEGSKSTSSPAPPVPEPASVVAGSGLSSSSESHISPRQERKIRGQNDVYYGWFISTGSRPIDQPVLGAGAARESDVFVHVHDVGRQIWLRSPSSAWLSIQCGHQHPLLATHRLILNANGEPRWVTRQTMVTYASREKN